MPVKHRNPICQHRSIRKMLTLGIFCLLLLGINVHIIYADERVLPELKFSTYLGGDSTEYGQDIAIDKAGNIYVTGTTHSTDFPTTTSIGAAGDSFFVSKFDPTGTTLLYSMVLGTNAYAYGIAVDEEGAAYVVGEGGVSMPTVNPLQPAHGGGMVDAFVAKLNPSGTALEYATYLGGSGVDTAVAVAVDSAHNLYVAGVTTSTDFPTQNAYDNTHGGGQDGFITKINPSGTALVYSTYYGATMTDVVLDIEADTDGNAYLTGRTTSSDFPVVNAYQPVPPGSCPYPDSCSNAYVAKLNPSGMPVFSTYLGGTGSSEAGMGIAVDVQGNIYVAGNTDSTDFPVRNAYQSVPSITPAAFVTKFNPGGTSLAYSTYLGGTDDSSIGTRIAVDDQGRAAVSGITLATNFPTVEPIQANRMGTGHSADIFISRFNADGRSLQFSTYLGGSQSENNYGRNPAVAVGRHNLLAVIGITSSNDFPTVNAYQSQRGGTSTNPDTLAQDAFITVLVLPPRSEPAEAATRNYFTTDTPTLTWTAISWATHYHIQVSKNKLFTGTLDFEGETPATQLSIPTDSLPDGLYYWRVQAQKADGSWGSYSPVESFTVYAN